MHDEDALARTYDARLMRRLLKYVAPYKLLVGGALGGLMYNTLFGSKGKTIDALEATPIAAKVRA